MTRAQLYFSCGLVIATGVAINLGAWLWLGSMVPAAPPPQGDLSSMARAACAASFGDPAPERGYPQERLDAICGCVAGNLDEFKASDPDAYAAQSAAALAGDAATLEELSAFTLQLVGACDTDTPWPPRG